MSSLNVRATENEAEEETTSNKGKSKQKQCNTTFNFDDSQFPEGMKVLVVDENAVCLKVITTLLLKCRYQVTAMNDSAKALMLLKQNEDNFDIVLTNVQNTGQVDGFKLLEAGLELDIPVIMISAKEDVEIVKKGVIHGARHFLLKPVCFSEIKNIWQHVYRKNISKFPNIIGDGHQENKEDVQRKRNSSCIDDDNNAQPSEERKRIRWTQPLHAKFVDAVIKLGGVDKAVPTKILDIMKENDITREKVASHLQKYRKSIKNNFGIDNHGRKMQHKEETIATPSDQSIVISPNIASERLGIMDPLVSRHHLPNANGTRGRQAAAKDYPQSNALWSMNPFNQPQPLDIRPNQWMMQQQPKIMQLNQPQPLDIRPNQMMMQQQPKIMQLGGNLVGGLNHIHQPYHHHMPYGDFRSLYSDSIDLSGKQVTDEFEDWPLAVAPPPFEAIPANNCSYDGELHNNF